MNTVPTEKRTNVHTAAAPLTQQQIIPYAHFVKDSTPKMKAIVRSLRKNVITAEVRTATTIILHAQSATRNTVPPIPTVPTGVAISAKANMPHPTIPYAVSVTVFMRKLLPTVLISHRNLKSTRHRIHVPLAALKAMTPITVVTTIPTVSIIKA